MAALLKRAAMMAIIASNLVSGQMISTPVIQSSHTMGAANYVLQDLCYDPIHEDVVYATADHAIIKFDWSGNADSATVTVVAGTTYSGHTDDTGNYAKFNDPLGCTPFGELIAIADQDNAAIRTMELKSGLARVDTLISKGSSGYTDGPYNPGKSSSGSGVHVPTYVEATNSTHLIVGYHSSRVRLIDTTAQVITTLLEIGLSFMSMFLDYERQGLFMILEESDTTFEVYNFPLHELYGESTVTIGDYLKVKYTGTNNGIDSVKNGDKQDTVLAIILTNWGADVGDYLMLPDSYKIDMVNIISKGDYSTTTYMESTTPTAVTLVPGNPDYIYIADKRDLKRLSAVGIVPNGNLIGPTTQTPTTTEAPTTTTTEVPAITTTEVSTTTTTEMPTTTTTEVPTTTTEVQTTTTTEVPAITTTEAPTTTEVSTTTTTEVPTTTTEVPTTTTTEVSTTTTTEVPTTTTEVPTTTNTEVPMSTTTPTTTTEPLMTTTETQERTTIVMAMTIETLHNDVPAGEITRYSVTADGYLCPEEGRELSSLIVENAMICSIHCSNIFKCSAFGFNRSTGKCKLLELSPQYTKPETGSSYDVCYRSFFTAQII